MRNGRYLRKLLRFSSLLLRIAENNENWFTFITCYKLVILIRKWCIWRRMICRYKSRIPNILFIAINTSGRMLWTLVRKIAKGSIDLRVKLPPVYHTRWRLHTVSFIIKRQAGKLWIQFYSLLLCESTAIETQVYRFSSRRSIHSTSGWIKP